MYCYQIMRNGSIEHTSQLFPSLEAAEKYFMNEDVPHHYAKMKFKPSVAVTGALSALISGGVHGPEHIFVQFTEVELKPVDYGEWSDLLHRKRWKRGEQI